jgi:hypothetical protein
MKNLTSTEVSSIKVLQFTSKELIAELERVKAERDTFKKELIEAKESNGHFLEKVQDRVQEYVSQNIDFSLVDLDSAEFSIGYNNLLTLEDISLDHNEIDNLITRAFESASESLLETDEVEDKVIDTITLQEVFQDIDRILFDFDQYTKSIITND